MEAALPGAGATATRSEAWLEVGDGHVLRVETWGAPGGVPAVYLHGGPGSGCHPAQRSLFDPARLRVAFVDQRGAGRSRPARERRANTTAHLVADLERVREAMGVERWLVVGGSWGATLGLAYAEAYPERVTGLVLRAVFLGTRGELDWAFGEGLRRFHPGLHEDFLAALPEAERAAPLEGYWRRILDPDPSVHVPAARAWFGVERALSELVPGVRRLDLAALRGEGPLPATPFMEAHYFSHGCFLRDGQLLAGAGRLAGIPGVIVQGRYDLLCPPATAHALAAAWPDARVEVVEAAGHSLGHAAVAEAVAAAVRELAG
jgi:proline iminopeptidase